MKKIILFLGLLVTIPMVSADTPKPIKGTREAALEAVTWYLHGYYKVPKEAIKRVLILGATVDSLTVQATFRKNACTLQLHKDSSAQGLGWVVQQHRCDPEWTRGDEAVRSNERLGYNRRRSGGSSPDVTLNRVTCG